MSGFTFYIDIQLGTATHHARIHILHSSSTGHSYPPCPDSYFITDKPFMVYQYIIYISSYIGLVFIYWWIYNGILSAKNVESKILPGIYNGIISAKNTWFYEFTILYCFQTDALLAIPETASSATITHKMPMRCLCGDDVDLNVSILRY